jgi:hypothetical protein
MLHRAMYIIHGAYAINSRLHRKHSAANVYYIWFRWVFLGLYRRNTRVAYNGDTYN